MHAQCLNFLKVTMVDRARKAKFCRQSNVSGDVFDDVFPAQGYGLGCSYPELWAWAQKRNYRESKLLSTRRRRRRAML